MTNRHSTKHALLTSLMALLLCFTMLLGTTYAWFTDSVTSAGNKIQAGTLKIDLELYDADTDAFASIKESKAPIFDYELWEPGYTDVKLLKVENEGNLALKWKATLVGVDVQSTLANVIDVYVLPLDTSLALDDDAAIAELPADRTLADYAPAGTLAEFIAGIETTTVGTLEAGKSAYLGIALKMQEDAGNEYQNLSLGTFDVQILATQLNAELDSFDENYDENAEFSAVSTVLTIPDNATQTATLKTEAVAVDLTPELQNALPAEVTAIQVAHSAPKVDAVAGKVTFDQLEVVDQNGNIVDLETLGNTEAISVTVYVGDAIINGAPVEIYHDGVKVADSTAVDGYVTYTATHFCEVEVLQNIVATGALHGSFISTDSVWAECRGNAYKSLEIKVYADDTYLGSTSLNNIDGIIDGDVFVTWHLYLDTVANADAYWTQTWEQVPTKDLIPNKTVLYIDGTAVDEKTINLNGPDDCFPIVAAVTNADGEIVKFFASLFDAMAYDIPEGGELVMLQNVDLNDSWVIG